MNKIKNCYKTLELEYGSSIDEIESKRQALIKFYKQKEKLKKCSCKEQIKKVNDDADCLNNYLKTNNLVKKDYKFDSTFDNIINEIFVVAILVVILFTLVSLL